MSFVIREPESDHWRVDGMLLNLAWLLLGLSTAALTSSLALTSDYLGIVLPEVASGLSLAILVVGTRIGGLEFLRDMVVPVELGVFYVVCQPLPGMAVMPLFIGACFGLANRLLARPVSLLGLIGQISPILSVGLLFWRHLGIQPTGTLAGLFCYALLSNRRSGRRVLPC